MAAIPPLYAGRKVGPGSVILLLSHGDETTKLLRFHHYEHRREFNDNG
jgi:hypothetical protein